MAADGRCLLTSSRRSEEDEYIITLDTPHTHTLYREGGNTVSENESRNCRLSLFCACVQRKKKGKNITGK
jgi:hypothetical protein